MEPFKPSWLVETLANVRLGQTRFDKSNALAYRKVLLHLSELLLLRFLSHYFAVRFQLNAMNFQKPNLDVSFIKLFTDVIYFVVVSVTREH